jgi:flagellar hook-basal body complex protein FliE
LEIGDLKIHQLQEALSQAGAAQEGSGKGSAGFEKLVREAVQKVSGMERDANRSISSLLEGKADVHEVMIALQKADVSMRLLLTVRNKVIEAYKEIMHMQF